MDECESQRACTAAQIVDGASAEPLLVVVGPRIFVRCSVPQCVVEEYGDLTRGCCDRFCLADPRRESTVECAEGRACLAYVDGRDPKCVFHAS